MKIPNSRHFEPTVSFTRFELYRGLGKRAFDIVLILLILPILLPLTGILTLLVAFDGGKPLFSQARVGKNGKSYRMWLLRSTVKEADAQPTHHRRHEQGSDQELVDERRLTKFGQFLRKTSLDELPQFYNVLTGDMSIVGPLPLTVSQQQHYLGEDYYDLRPGLTGNWSMPAWHHMTLDERADYDSQYNRNLSFASDLGILAATVKSVLR